MDSSRSPRIRCAGDAPTRSTANTDASTEQVGVRQQPIRSSDAFGASAAIPLPRDDAMMLPSQLRLTIALNLATAGVLVLAALKDAALDAASLSASATPVLWALVAWLARDSPRLVQATLWLSVVLCGLVGMGLVNYYFIGSGGDMRALGVQLPLVAQALFGCILLIGLIVWRIARPASRVRR